MRKIKSMLMAVLLSVVSILLPVSAPVFAAVGDPMTSTISVSSGFADKMDGNMEFDSHQLSPTGGTTPQYDSTGSNHTIKFGFSIEYGEISGYTLEQVTVNGVNTAFSPLGEDRYSISVAEMANYVLDFTLSGGTSSYSVIWGNPGCVDIDDDDAMIKNGYAKVIAVYDGEGNLINADQYSLPDTDHGLKNNCGLIFLRPGSQAVFEFTPIYGYQLTSVKANDIPLEAQAATNQYTFTMREGHVHFAATFTRTADVVKTNSEAVSGGSVSLGSALDGGTAQLIVSDTEVDETKLAGFNNAAGNYSISQILNIDFFNVFYKGKADSSDVWANQLHELGEEATITLEFADDVDVAHVVLVHNINDGEDFEIINPISYDVAAHTATFRVKSFSNFAIATEVGMPNSGFVSKSDNVSFATSTISMTVFVATIISAGAWFTFRNADKK